MPKSKLRKNHKKKVQQFHQRVATERNDINKMENIFMKKLLDYNENARKEAVIERLHQARPEFVVEHEGTFIVNEELIETQNEMLVWKEDGNPILAGLETLDFMPVYQLPVVNLILRNYYAHYQKKLAANPEAGMQVQETDAAELGFDPAAPVEVEFTDVTPSAE